MIFHADVENRNFSHTKMLKFVLRDAILFAVAGITLGFIIDLFFTDPTRDETIPQTIILILLQTIVCATIVWFIAKAYEKTFGSDPDQFYGLTMFSVLFFLVQVQLFERVAVLYQTITKHKLNPVT
jgi:hypothetical protein